MRQQKLVFSNKIRNNNFFQTHIKKNKKDSNTIFLLVGTPRFGLELDASRLEKKFQAPSASTRPRYTMSPCTKKNSIKE